jgi:epsilon-lactone hydrolase
MSSVSPQAGDRAGPANGGAAARHPTERDRHLSRPPTAAETRGSRRIDRPYVVGVPSEEAAMVNEMLRAVDFAHLSLAEQRDAVDRGAAELPRGVTITPVDGGAVPCEWVDTGRDGRTIIALRGGGYCLGSLASNRHFGGLLAEVSGSRVLSVGYRNAPEHPFPAALDDVLDTYRWLLATGTDPAPVAIAGNSAGGGLALSVLLALRDAGDPLPAAAIALSPWTDLAATGESLRTNAATEVLLDPVHLPATAALYVDTEHLCHPYVSPLYGDLTGLPPLLVQASTSEILLDDATRLADRARGAGVDVTLHLADGVPHVWHLFADALPEAVDALVDLALWLDDRVSG